jgi:hypothetical protein
MDRIIFKVILLVVILGAIGYLAIPAETYSCDQCSVSFSNSKALAIKYYMTELFEESKLKDCPIYWDRVIGYVRQ